MVEFLQLKPSEIENLLDNVKIDNPKYDRSQFTKFLQVDNPKDIWTGCFEDGECKALAMVQRDTPFKGYHYLAEIQNFRKGYGKPLLKHILEEFGNVWLMCDMNGGEKLQGFYEQSEFGLEKIVIPDSVYGGPAFFYCTKSVDYDKLETYLIAFYSNDEGEEVEESKRREYSLKPKDKTYRPEYNQYAFKNRSDMYGGDDYVKTADILKLIHPNMTVRGIQDYRTRNWFRGDDHLDIGKSHMLMKLDDGKDSVIPVSDVMKSPKYRDVLYIDSTGDAMGTKEFAYKVSELESSTLLKNGMLVVFVNKEDESNYYCNGLYSEGDDVVLKMEWGDALDYTGSMTEAERDIGGEKYDQEETVSDSKLKIWIDDIRKAPEGYVWIKSVNDFVDYITDKGISNIGLIDTDHDAGDYQSEGGDYIKCFDYLDFLGAENITVHIHSANPVGANNIRRIISRNKEEKGWKEVRNT